VRSTARRTASTPRGCFAEDRAVDLRAVDVDLRAPVDFLAVDFLAVDFLAVDFLLVDLRAVGIVAA
jgi:hypothetical protein